MTAKGQTVEKPRPLGDRVYKKQRDMLTQVAKTRKLKSAEALRFCIEFTYDQLFSGKR